jgi:hypothetical protein
VNNLEGILQRRYWRIAALITPVLTIESQRRLDLTMQEGYAKAVASGASQEEINQVSAAMGERAHAFASRENAKRIRQWTEEILAAEEAWAKEHPPILTLRWLAVGAILGALAQLFFQRLFKD